MVDGEAEKKMYNQDQRGTEATTVQVQASQEG
jgi:hypothetical protein